MWRRAALLLLLLLPADGNPRGFTHTHRPEHESILSESVQILQGLR